ncbi:hypothetical protein ABT56_19115 [Photobacterium aquae]|uniref:TraG N-terminal Proteobacteria domain-containing protein n=1 Tax=Photobacterium aquae TaxID=1195763 RepID=A0A0J1GUX0_9GAMM|nr:conjugal transfer protein TraG N-terminal domain-containing protein [Photobacterium aquae]KLV03540.1 hypothetical protein ABT56_19115 [Photobacterium aquae]
MSIYNIYSYGDPEVLFNTLNGVATIFDDSVYNTISQIIALFAFILLLIRSLHDGARSLPIPLMICGLFTFQLCLMEKSTVNITNKDTSQTLTVDNIPIGIALPYSVITYIGHTLLEKTETGYGLNGQQKFTENGFLKPLRVVAQMRKESLDISKNMGQILNNINGINFTKTMQLYADKCVAFENARNNSFDESYIKDAMTTITSNSKMYGTVIIGSSGNITEVSCYEAFQQLNSIMDVATDAAMTTLLKQNNFVMDESNPSTTMNAEYFFTDTLNAFIGESGSHSLDARKYMQALMLQSFVEDSQLNYYRSIDANDLYENLSGSIQQRHYQWIIQGEIWADMVWDILTYLEACLFAIAPFVLLGLLIGTFGLKVFAGYLQLILITQLIPILMVVISSSIYGDIANYVSSLSNIVDEGSFLFTMRLASYSYTKLGYGGMLATTFVPILAMFLVTGSAMGLGAAIKGIASQPAKDSDAMPETLKQQGAIIDMGGYRQQGYIDGVGGISKMTESKMNSFTESSAYANTLSEAKRKSIQAREDFNDTLSNGHTIAGSTDWGYNQMANFGNSIKTNDSQQMDYMLSTAKSISNNHSLNDTEASILNSAATLGVSKFGSGAAITSSGSQQYSTNLVNALQDLEQIQSSQNYQVGLENAIAADISSGHKISTGNQLMDSVVEEQRKAYSEAKSAEESYSDMLTFSQEFSTGSTTDKLGMISNLLDNDNMHGRVHDYVNSLSPNQQQEYYRNLNDIQSRDSLNDDAAMLVAALNTMSQFNDTDAMQNIFTNDRFDTPENTTGSEVEIRGGLDTKLNTTIDQEPLPDAHEQYAIYKNNVEGNYVGEGLYSRDEYIWNESKFDNETEQTRTKFNQGTTELMNDSDVYHVTASSVNGGVAVGKATVDGFVDTVDEVFDFGFDEKSNKK